LKPLIGIFKFSYRTSVKRGFITIALGLGFLSVFIYALSALGQTSGRQAQSLKELIDRYDTSRCRECHEEIYAQWEKSHHARSIMDILMDDYLKKGVLSVRSAGDATKKNFPCFKCHLPQIENATDKVASEIAAVILKNDKATMKKLNINCLVCHHDHGVVHGLPKDGVLYGTSADKEHPDTKYKSVIKSPVMKRPAMCGRCHGLGPNYEFEHPVQCATLYGSYLHAYVPSGGEKTCQQCHMEKADHTCPPNFQDRKQTSARLSRALPLDVRVMFYLSQYTPEKYVPTVVVSTRIQSKAGHRIPDG